MLKSQKIIVKWHPNNKKYYEDKGYCFTKFGLPFEVEANEVVPTAKIDVVAVCDLCGKEFVLLLCNYTRSIRNTGNCVCKDCRATKVKSTLMNKYGVDSPAKIEGISEKTKEVFKNKYGVENPMQVFEFKEKAKKTLFERYGVEHPLQNKEIKEKACNTCLEKFGVSNSFSSNEIREKIKNALKEKYGVENPGLYKDFVEKAKRTCVERYGGKSSQCSPEIRKKSWESMKDKNGLPSSKLEQKLVEILLSIYGKEQCYPSEIVNGMCYDCLLCVNNIKIDVEYDGWYWHKENRERDKRRDYYSIRHGYKVLRIISNGSLPSIEQIKKGVDYLVNSEHHIYKIVLDNIKLQEEDII